MKHSSRALKRFAYTQVAAALALGATSAAWGVGLGKLSVQSALGETLRAEIELTSLSPEEAGTLKVRVASPDSYRASGIDYNPILTTAQVQMVQSGGRTVLRVSSDRAVQEPFVDVILELNWASGRLVREYTLLFDPPTSKPASAPSSVATAPVIAPAPAAAPAPVAAEAPAPMAAAPTTAPRPAPAASRPAPTPKMADAAAPKPAPAPTGASEYTVKPGDSLSRIAGKTQPAGISLDQMLVGLYRANPDAFIDSNMNLLKSGSVLQVPGSEQLGNVSTGEARQVIQAQSADFNAYRQRLAGAAPTLKQDESQRQAKGQVQAAVEDKKPAVAQAPDKLTLSKAASAAAEVKASKATEKKDSATRVAELTRNVEELKKLQDAAKPAPAPVVAPAPAPAPVPVVAAAPAPVVAASVPSQIVPPPVVAQAASKPASKPVVVPAPAPAPSSDGIVDLILQNPGAFGGGLLALLGLAGFGFYRYRNRNNSKADTGFHESRLAPDSFFGQTGGQRVDTRDATSASSMSYSLSQLDAIGDVDPVAEADVYLAYGRDLQAEEILKEALRANPERMAIRIKLLEVYAKRRDTRGFEQLAVQLFAETGGTGEDWLKAQELGRQIDAENPLYQPGGAPAQPDDGPAVHPEPMDASTMPATITAPSLMPTEPMALTPSSMGDPGGPISGFDLDLDLGSPPAAPPVSPNAMAATQAMSPSVSQSPMAMDFDLSAPPEDLGADLKFDLDDLGSTPAAPPASGGGLDFDLSSVSLDLPKTEAPSSSSDDIESTHSFDLTDDEGDPLQRQLELAEEFRQIGDVEGAREVLQEVIGKSSGELQAKARAMLDKLN
ncbi:MAG TPA: FimV/HubP family polar landmark protein [Burkholderiaceae bacterium]